MPGYSVIASRLEGGVQTKDYRMGNRGLKTGEMISGRKTIRGRRKQSLKCCMRSKEQIVMGVVRLEK